MLLGVRQALDHRLGQVRAEILETPSLKRNRAKSFRRSGHTPTDTRRREHRVQLRDVPKWGENEGRVVDDLWTDIPPVNSQATDRIGYPTQKPSHCWSGSSPHPATKAT